MRIPRSLAVLGAAGVLAGAAPAGLAHADSTPQPRATGNFFYFNRFDGQLALVNPPNDRCLPISADNIAGPISNLTDQNALVFVTSDCTGSAVFPVQRGTTTYVPYSGLKSVLFPTTS